MGIAALPRVVAFTAGVLVVHALAVLPDWPWLLGLCLPALVPWRLRSPWAWVIAGFAWTVLRAQPILDERWPPALHGVEREAQGVVASLPERNGEDWRFLFAPDDPALPRSIQAGWYRTDAVVRAGACWRLTLRMRAPHGTLNPGGFDYEGWLFRQRIGAMATVRAAQPCESPRPAPLLRLRQRLADDVRLALGDRPATAFVLALTIGDASGFTHDDWDLFRATGTSHLVAISGFNIAIAAGIAFVLGRWAWCLWPPLCLRCPAQRAALVVSAVAAGGYALVAGFEPPVQRAVLMLWIALAAAWSHRTAPPSRVLAVAWLAVLLVDPLAVTSPGLWLSFGAVAAIFYVSLGRVEPPGPWHALVAMQLLIAVALAPLTLFFFQGASWAAAPVNLLAVPFFAVLTPWALAGLLLHLAWPDAGELVLNGAALALELFRAALDAVTHLPHLWIASSPSPCALALALAGVVLLFAPRGVPLRALGALCFVPLAIASPEAPDGLALTVLDVGQGLAVVVRTPHHALLYDAGPAFDDGFDAGASVVAPFLLQAGVTKLDALMLSHGDLDHRGGVPAVRRLVGAEHEIGTDRGEPCVEGRRWRWDDVDFEVLNGPAPGLSDNDGGCVLLVRSRRYSVLLPADIEARTEQRLVAAYGERLHVDVLVAPHHGSRTSSTAAFVAAVRPRIVVYGAGWRNHFRHPRPEVVARYGAIGASQHVTASAGAVTIDAVSEGLRVREYRPAASRFWNAPPGP